MLLYGLDIWHVSWLHMHMHMHMNMRPSVNKSSPNTTHMKSVFSARDRVRLAIAEPALAPLLAVAKDPCAEASMARSHLGEMRGAGRV